MFGRGSTLNGIIRVHGKKWLGMFAFFPYIQSALLSDHHPESQSPYNEVGMKIN